MERQWVLVTGASEGIGRAFAELAAGKGFDLILVARGREKLEEVASVVRGMGREAEVIAADLSVPAEVERAWGEASAGRRIGWLINNAGLGSHGKFANPDHWARERLSLDVNIDALTRLMKLARAAGVSSMWHPMRRSCRGRGWRCITPANPMFCR